VAEIEYEIRDEDAQEQLMTDLESAGYAFEVMTISGRRASKALKG
jgi:threonine dehydratase